MSVTVHGADQLVGDLDRLAGQLPDLVADTAAELLADHVRRTAPVRTGALVRSVHAAGAGVDVGVRYAVYVAADNPFIARAVATADTALTARLEPTIERHLP